MNSSGDLVFATKKTSAEQSLRQMKVICCRGGSPVHQDAIGNSKTGDQSKSIDVVVVRCPSIYSD